MQETSDIGGYNLPPEISKALKEIQPDTANQFMAEIEISLPPGAEASDVKIGNPSLIRNHFPACFYAGHQKIIIKGDKCYQAKIRIQVHLGASVLHVLKRKFHTATKAEEYGHRFVNRVIDSSPG